VELSPLPPYIAGPFTLGTAQLGTIYGLSAVQPSTIGGAAHSILNAAAKGGIVWLDTARAYGQSELQIGRWLGKHEHGFRIVTKIPSLAAVADAEAGAATSASIMESLRSLGVSSIDICLTHRSQDLLRPPVARALTEAQSSGLISLFGASAYSCEEVDALLSIHGIGALQIPMNVANARFRDSGLLARASQRGTAVFVRSVFLQGALLMGNGQLPAHLSALQSVVARLRSLADESNVTLTTLLMEAVRSVPGVSSLVLGVDSVQQLNELLAAAAAPPLDRDLIDAAFEAARGLPESVIDPRRWPRRN
jgi:aryl-alcohol dehydrogenase-like predicted oxidoreductase